MQCPIDYEISSVSSRTSVFLALYERKVPIVPVILSAQFAGRPSESPLLESALIIDLTPLYLSDDCLLLPDVQRHENFCFIHFHLFSFSLSLFILLVFFFKWEDSCSFHYWVLFGSKMKSLIPQNKPMTDLIFVLHVEKNIATVLRIDEWTFSSSYGFANR